MQLCGIILETIIWLVFFYGEALLACFMAFAGVSAAAASRQHPFDIDPCN